MEPSTTTAIYLRSFGSDRQRDGSTVVEKLYEIGYRTLDYGFASVTHPDFILRGDDWQKKVEKVANTAARLGVRFSQSHVPFIRLATPQYDPSFQQAGFREYYDECMRRAFIASGMLGVRYATAHPLSFPEENFERAVSLKKNHEYYDKYVELGMQHGVGTAFENMLPSLDRKIADHYCQHYEDLIEYVDSFNDPMVGICWDTGHANMMQFDQKRALRKVDHRLKNLHINDNHYGTRDEHLLPFMGSINWYELIPVLAEIDYDGDMTFETMKVGAGADGPIQESIIRLTYESGCFLKQLFEDAQKQLGKRE